MLSSTALASPTLIKLPQIDHEQVADEIGQFLVNKVLSVNATGGVIGFSGGADSCAMGALAKRGFDQHNAQHPHRPLELFGKIMPSALNDPQDAEAGVSVAERLGIRYRVTSMEPYIAQYMRDYPELAQKPYDAGNLHSRIRANHLHTEAGNLRKSVIGTGNWLEDFCLGYYTMFGDGAVHSSPIGNLSKRLVFSMLHFLGFSEAAQREPTAGLEPNQTDFKDLGYRYNTAEFVFEGLRQGINEQQIHQAAQVIAAMERDIVEYEAKFGAKKFSTVQEAVADMLKRHHESALKKIEIIHPPAAEVTLRYE